MKNHEKHYISSESETKAYHRIGGPIPVESTSLDVLEIVFFWHTNHFPGGNGFPGIHSGSVIDTHSPLMSA